MTLWGGPCRVFGRSLSNEELKELNAPYARRLNIISLDTDDDGRWNIQMDIILAGVEVHAVQLDREAQARVQLADGGWLTIEGDGRDLANNAFVLEMLIIDEAHQLEDRTWKGLGMRAIAIENALPE